MSTTTGTQKTLTSIWGIRRDFGSGSSGNANDINDASKPGPLFIPKAVLEPNDADMTYCEESITEKRADQTEPDRFIVTLRVAPDKLRSVSKKRPQSTIEDPTGKKIHPFFLNSKKVKEKEKEKEKEREKEKQAESSASASEEHVKKELPQKAPEPPKGIIHPFFSNLQAKKEARKESSSHKNASQATSDRPVLRKYSNVQQEPCFPRVAHVRGLPSIQENPAVHTVETTAMALSKSAPKGKHKHMSVYIPPEDYVYRKKTWKNVSIQTDTPTKTGERLLLPGSAVTKIAQNLINPENLHRLNHLLDTCSQPKAFDTFSCETQMWSTKYSPKSIQAVVTGDSTAYTLFQWTHKKLQKLKKGASGKKSRPKRTKRVKEMDDFIVDDDFGDDDPDELTEDEMYASTEDSFDFMIVHGPPGSGKSAAVQAVASELGAFLFELNSSQRRTGKEVTSLLEKVGESHSVYAANDSKKTRRDTLIFLEEVDVLYEEERSLWPAVAKFAEVTRRPIIMSCNDINCIPQVIADNSLFLEFRQADDSLAQDCLLLIALNEGHLVTRQSVGSILKDCNGDLRKSLNILQYLCQIGVGWRPSGVEWFIDEYERKQIEQTGNTARVLCRETADKKLYKDGPPTTEITPSKHELDSFDAFVEQLDLMSDADILGSNTHSQIPVTMRSSSETTIDVSNCSEVSRFQPPMPFELNIGDYIKDHLQGFNDQLPFNKPLPPKRTKEKTIRQALSSLSYPFSLFGSECSNSNYNCIDHATLSVLTSEIAPVIRSVARIDKQRRDTKSRLTETTDGKRLSKRSFTARGIVVEDEYFGDDSPLEEMIATGPVLQLAPIQAYIT